MRKKRAEKRWISPDPRFNDVTIERFINNLLLDGKKSTARDILYGALDLVAERTQQDPLEVFRKALANVSPAVEVRSRRVGGSTYQVPMEVRPERRVALGIRWLIKYADDRREKTMRDKLAGEIIAASNGEGSAVKKREDVHRMADANRAFAHFRW
ncbi:MAG: 30S ribosomal protein S7 [Chlorobi bacterium]|nr:MAG: 30S ribosomal protein S7 [Chlorobi bacterium OLB7]MBK8909927.1 30S ribosomal protein S7 [Chlorobiota bacterium]MBX7218145.1 30S ribosomal protein S7 [Candidatus Kapabacteria bacterium]